MIFFSCYCSDSDNQINTVPIPLQYLFCWKVSKDSMEELQNKRQTDEVKKLENIID